MSAGAGAGSGSMGWSGPTAWSSERRPDVRPAAREALLAAGRQILWAADPSDLLPGIRATCRAAGRSTRQAYVAFPSVADLQVEVVRRLLADLADIEAAAVAVSVARGRARPAGGGSWASVSPWLRGAMVDRSQVADLTEAARHRAFLAALGRGPRIGPMAAGSSGAGMSSADRRVRSTEAGSAGHLRREIRRAVGRDRAGRVARLESVLTEVVRSLGLEVRPPVTAGDLAEVLVALVDGLALRGVADPTGDLATVFEDAVRALALGVLRPMGSAGPDLVLPIDGERRSRGSHLRLVRNDGGEEAGLGSEPGAKAGGERLVQAGRDLVVGVTAAGRLPGLRDVCRRADRPTGVFYNWFGDLRSYHLALLTDIADEACARPPESFDRGARSADPPAGRQGGDRWMGVVDHAPHDDPTEALAGRRRSFGPARTGPDRDGWMALVDRMIGGSGGSGGSGGTDRSGEPGGFEPVDGTPVVAALYRRAVLVHLAGEPGPGAGADGGGRVGGRAADGGAESAEHVAARRAAARGARAIDEHRRVAMVAALDAWLAASGLALRDPFDVRSVAGVLSAIGDGLVLRTFTDDGDVRRWAHLAAHALGTAVAVPDGRLASDLDAVIARQATRIERADGLRPARLDRASSSGA